MLDIPPVIAWSRIIKTKDQPPGQIEIGDDIYLFKSPYNVGNKLVISSHGGYLPGMKFLTPISVTFLSPHNTTLIDPGTESVLHGEVYPYERAPAGEVLHDYLLTKFKPDLYEDLSQAISSPLCRYDLVTIRNRGRSLGCIRLSTVITTLLKQGHLYSEIICSFCRSKLFGKEKDYWASINTQRQLHNVMYQIGIE